MKELICPKCSKSFKMRLDSYKKGLYRKQKLFYCSRICREGTLEERFWAKVKIGNLDECWPWQGGRRDNSGYGEIKDGKITYSTHRLSWILHNGSIESTTILLPCRAGKELP